MHKEKPWLMALKALALEVSVQNMPPIHTVKLLLRMIICGNYTECLSNKLNETVIRFAWSNRKYRMLNKVCKYQVKEKSFPNHFHRHSFICFTKPETSSLCLLNALPDNWQITSDFMTKALTNMANRFSRDPESNS